MNQAEAALKLVDQHLADSVERLFALLRFPSIGTDPAFHRACQQAAGWLQSTLQELGFQADLHSTTGQPALVARAKPAPTAAQVPHLLFYGHYDVQPADPLNLWDSPPFEPELRKGKDGREHIFARGACDDKGQLMTFVEACRFWQQAHGSLPFALTLLIEGDEEGDTSHIDRFIAAHRADFQADLAVICDTDMWDGKTPAIITSLRGCIGLEVTLTGPRIDLHSGYYGGAAVNPLKVLSRIIADLHDAQGRIAIPGFYDDVRMPDEATLQSWGKLKATPRRILGPVGLKTPAGEEEYTLLEQLWARPTAEVNGLQGGYTGVGSKTVLPAKAMAKFSFRLVHGQKPAKIKKAFKAFVKARLPADTKVTFTDHGGDSSGIAMATDGLLFSAARRALRAEWGTEPVLVGDGASIPVVESFKKHVRLDSLLMGFGRADDAIHAPNEKYDMESYHRGIRSWIRFFAEIAAVKH